ncbi:sensor histidine kinase [Nocardioides jiangxiensis]|uniref:ATP-binding protein n=1 Tax=Nocardioides jiangxiensis TaxID=3064524 RepID=A0ABT9AXL3_9ACTN|nr:ATP-binding protein [Nocardioides sp. WY-20]MDO7867304.1 ATP-binding protein [Nocardioides sp. WY-20]
MTRLSLARLSLARQLLLLQMLMVVLVVGVVGWVSTVQADQSFRRHETRRLLATAEATATEGVVRGALVLDDPATEADESARLRESLPERLERVRAAAGASYIMLVAVDDDVLTALPPLGKGDPLDLAAATRRGAGWTGTTERFGQKSVEAQVAVFADGSFEQLGIAPGDVIGYLTIGRNYPSRLEVLRAAIPNALLYFAIAGAIGVGGSLLIARRVKRQTLGLEPGEITALVEQREAMLHGVREGVLGVDGTGRVAFANDEAVALLELPGPSRGRRVDELEVGPEVRAALRGEAAGRDVVVAVGGRLLVLNTQPVRIRARRTGWVTTMRDRTELLALEQELAAAQAGTDTLRAQVHEFRNRLHAIAGMAELGRMDRVSEFVHAVMSDLDGRVGQVSAQVDDPAVASLLVAKASRADELGIDFLLTPESHLGVHDAALSADLVTVVGNLVDNAFDAVSPGGRVQVELAESAGRIVVEVADTGGGIAAEDLARVFELGWTTKHGSDAALHGFGLALTRMACRRHGGSVTVGQREGAVLRAELYTDEAAR